MRLLVHWDEAEADGQGGLPWEVNGQVLRRSVSGCASGHWEDGIHDGQDLGIARLLMLLVRRYGLLFMVPLAAVVVILIVD